MLIWDYLHSRPLPTEGFEFALDDDTPSFVRPLRPEDAPRLHEGLDHLSHLASRRKFPFDGEQSTAQIIEQVTHADGTHEVAWGAADLNAPDQPGIGVARYQRLEHEPDAADVAIVILDQYMNKGAGVLLHAVLHLQAHHAGLHHLYYDVAADNQRFIRHLRSLGAEYVGRAVDVTRLKCPVFGEAYKVSHLKPNARRFAQTLRRLSHVPPSTLGQEDADDQSMAI